MLTYKDLIKSKEQCYLTHPKRDDDTDDMLLDVANQFRLSKQEFNSWVADKRSWAFMEEFLDIDLEVSDFLDELSDFYE